MALALAPGALDGIVGEVPIPRRSGSSRAPPLRARTSSRKIDIGFLDQLIGANFQAVHQSLRDAMPSVLILTWPEHDLELDEVSQSLDPVEMDAVWPTR